VLFILKRGAAPEASLDYGQQIHCVVIWVHSPQFEKWRLTDGILLFLWLEVEMWLKGRCVSYDKHQSESRMVRFDGIQ
jgi:hypothetical protein